MKILFFAVLLSLAASAPCQAISEADFQKLYNSSEALRNADQLLNRTWKEVSANIPASEKKSLLNFQRDWVKTGRDESAREYLDEGYDKACAYAIATVRWAKNLRVLEYNFNLGEADQGSAKADDAFWNEDEDIPPECRKN